MASTRHLIAAALAGLALAAAGCDSDNSEEEPANTSGRTQESPVNPDSPGGNQGQTTPAPNQSERPETDEGETAP
jgi:hypothetical protein